MNRDELLANVQTIVIVMMENRSFDHVLGHLSHPDDGNRTDVEGIEDLANPRYENAGADGVAVAPFWMPDGTLPSDVPHSKGAVATQIAFDATSGTFGMNGFVRAYEKETLGSGAADSSPVMGLLRSADLPTTSALAARYTVCDHWFACLPTSTAPNRLMSMCGDTTIDDTHTLLPDQPTVYDWLTAHGVRWRVYSAGLPFLMLMPKVAPMLLTSHFRDLEDLPRDVDQEADADWPQVIFVEPDYHDCPVHLHAPCATPCDNHAPLSMAAGEAFLALVYRALTGNPARWAQTVFVVTYDEHGGFFDHVAPPAVAYRNGSVAFDSAGVRTPTIVAGPFAPASAVCKTVLDNTSILQLLAERFGKPQEPYSPSVATRAATVASLSSVLVPDPVNTTNATIGATAVGAPPHPTPVATGSATLRTAFHAAITNFLAEHGAQATAKYPSLQGYGR